MFIFTKHIRDISCFSLLKLHNCELIYLYSTMVCRWLRHYADLQFDQKALFTSKYKIIRHNLEVSGHQILREESLRGLYILIAFTLSVEL